MLNTKIISSWEGTDSTMFLAKGETYIKQLVMLMEQVNACGVFINDSISSYEEIEKKYEEAVSS
jgi:hypothetical protein